MPAIQFPLAQVAPGLQAPNVTPGTLDTLLSATASAGQLPGTTTNDNAAAGAVGEYLSAQLLLASAVSLSNGVAANVLSLALTAGDWDVSGVVAYHSATGTTIPSDVKQGFSTTSATMGAQGTYTYDYIGLAITDDPFYLTPTDRIQVPPGGATIYLVSQADFTVSTLTAYGNLRARRAR